jgi:hypothetical protein
VKELQRRGDPNVVIALAGNKADMESKRKVTLLPLVPFSFLIFAKKTFFKLRCKPKRHSSMLKTAT